MKGEARQTQELPMTCASPPIRRHSAVPQAELGIPSLVGGSCLARQLHGVEGCASDDPRTSTPGRAGRVDFGAVSVVMMIAGATARRCGLRVVSAVSIDLPKDQRL